MAEDLLVTVLGLVVLVSVGVAIGASLVGCLGVLTGGRLERCPRCHHYGFIVEGRPHAQGCPAPSHLHSYRH